MNNFADEPKDKDEEIPDFRETQTEESSFEEDEMHESGFFQRRAVRVSLRILGGLFIIGTAISLYWARIPRTFDVTDASRVFAVAKGHRELDEPLPKGYRTVATTILLAKQLLEKPGGYQSNDVMPMTRIPDNMRNWEFGCLIQLRVMVQGLRYELSRSGPQSGEHPELQEAEARFNFKHDKWIIPSAESQYRDGISFLEQYIDNLSNAETEGKFFTARQDQVIKWLDRQKLMLGTYATRLQNNVGAVPYNTGVLTSENTLNMDPAVDTDQEKNPQDEDVTSFTERDDVFYQVRGGVYVMYHVMLAMRKDCETILNNAQAMGIMNRVINELESACKPMGSPIVLNGNEFGTIQNHSLVLGAHVAKAHLAVQELQKQIAGGGGN